MKIGVMTMNTDYGINPIALARRAEELGIESIFLPDHSHVPVNRKASYDGPKGAFPDSPGDMPKEYYHNYDQLIICGPVFPHEVAGFSSGTKYLFPGIAAPEIIHFTHWLGALITNHDVIGTFGETVVGFAR